MKLHRAQTLKVLTTRPEGRAQFNVLTGRLEYAKELRAKHVKHLPRAIKVWLDAMEAVDPDTGSPDYTIRLRAADSFADRFGLPKRQEVTGEDGSPLQQLTDAQIEERLHVLLAAYQGLPPPTVEPLDSA